MNRHRPIPARAHTPMTGDRTASSIQRSPMSECGMTPQLVDDKHSDRREPSSADPKEMDRWPG
jgi:hypothetical protein